jgi:hypothetical protein
MARKRAEEPYKEEAVVVVEAELVVVVYPYT